MTDDLSNETVAYRPYSEQDEGKAIGYSAFAAAPRVLHIDSDSDSALILAALLVPETLVTHASTIAAAQKMLNTEQYALVVMDPDLPDGDGSALLPYLREVQANARVLLYSARSPEQLGTGAFLPKPWTSPRQLWRTVSGLLDLAPVMPAEPQ